MSDSFVTLWTIAHQAPLSMGFPRQQYWTGLPFPSSGALSDPGIKPHLLHWQVGSLPLSHLGEPLGKVMVSKSGKRADACGLTDGLKSHVFMPILNGEQKPRKLETEMFLFEILS